MNNQMFVIGECGPCDGFGSVRCEKCSGNRYLQDGSICPGCSRGQSVCAACEGSGKSTVNLDPFEVASFIATQWASTDENFVADRAHSPNPKQAYGVLASPPSVEPTDDLYYIAAYPLQNNIKVSRWYERNGRSRREIIEVNIGGKVYEF